MAIVRDLSGNKPASAPLTDPHIPARGDSFGDVIPSTESDTLIYAQPFRAIRVAGAGNVVIKQPDGTERTLAFLAGETRAVTGIQVMAASTATGIERIE